MNDLRTRTVLDHGASDGPRDPDARPVSRFSSREGRQVETFYTLIIVTYILTIPSAILLRALTSPGSSHDTFLDSGGDRLPP